MKKLIAAILFVAAVGATTAFALDDDPALNDPALSGPLDNPTVQFSGWSCKEIDIAAEHTLLLERIAAADAAGDVDGAAQLRADEMALLACLS